MPYDTPLLIAEDEAALAAVCEHLKGEPFIGVDTEADSMYHYKEKVCLIQLTDRHRDYIVDPLAIGHIGGLTDILADPDTQKIFHGADYDVVSLRRDFDVPVRNIFDTMISAQILGLPKVGLADLCANNFGAKMDKKYQRYNWAARPLKPEHLDYARGDSHYLLSLREILLEKLAETGRLDVVEEEFLRLEDREWQPREPSPDDWMRVKGSRNLDDVGKHVLKHLYAYRNGQAKKLDRPPYKVIPDQFLLRVAEVKPDSQDKIRGLAKRRSNMLRRHGASLVTAVQAGLKEKGPVPEPAKKTQRGPRMPYGGRDSERLVQEFKNWRTKAADRKSIPVAMLASNAQLKVLAGFRPKSLEELEKLEDIRAWQTRRYGTEWLALLEDFGSKQPAASSGDGAPPAKRRRRRRRRRNGGSGGDGGS